MIKTKPILFTFGSILSIKDKKKTQTRRVIKSQPVIDEESGYVFGGYHRNMWKNDIMHRPWQESFIEHLCPYQINDILWIRETYYQYGRWKKDKKTFIPANDNVYYADQVDLAVIGNNTRVRTHKPGMYLRTALFMPKKYARYWIKITGIKIERLQDISQEDAKFEGVEWPAPHRPASEGCMPHADRSLKRDCFVCSYKVTWNQIHGPKKNNTQWDKNPWVWVYTFKLTKNPDQQ